MPTSNFQPVRLLDPDCCYKFTYLMANSADPDQLGPTDLHCLQRQGICGFSRTRVKFVTFHYCTVLFYFRASSTHCYIVKDGRWRISTSSHKSKSDLIQNGSHSLWILLLSTQGENSSGEHFKSIFLIFPIKHDLTFPNPVFWEIILDLLSAELAQRVIKVNP